MRGNERKIGLTFHEVLSTEGDGNQKKIVIDSIDPDSPVDYSSLKEGDVILEINGMPVIDAKQVSKLIRGSSRRQEVYVLHNTDLYIFCLNSSSSVCRNTMQYLFAILFVLGNR